MISYLELWGRLLDHYGRRRPIDRVTGWPLLTDADLVALGRRWTAALDDHAGELGQLHGALRRRWHGQRDRMRASGARVRAHRFWAASRDLADALTKRLRRGPRDASGGGMAGAVTAEDGWVRIQGMKDWVEMHTALKLFFQDRRGVESADGRKWPKTTNDDVRQLATMWTKAARGARTDVFGVKGAVARWKETAAEVVRLTATADPTERYPKNREFWSVSKRLAIRIQVAAEEPPEITFTDALIQSVRHLPDTLGDVFGAAGGAVKDAAEDAADVAGDVVGKVGKPLLIGAGIVGAAAVGVALLRR